MDKSAVLASLLTLSFFAIVAGDVTCHAPRSPDNGQSFISNDGQVVTYRCNPGFRMRGYDRSVCVNNEWTSSPPVCVGDSVYDPDETSTFDYSCLQTDEYRRGVLINAPKLPNGYIVRYDRLRHRNYPYKHYLAVQYNCNAGYSFEDRRFDRLYCRRGQWVGYIPRCVPRDPHSTRNVVERSCAVDNGGCEHFCTSYRGNVMCFCKQGYKLGEDKTSCADINECLDNNGGCQQHCWNTKGTFVCSCSGGFVLANDRKSCVATSSSGTGGGDELQMVSREAQDGCAVRNGGCGQICQVVDGEVKCSCREGFKLTDNGKMCVDVNECLQNNGGCQYYCFNSAGSFRCYCPRGFWLTADRRSCTVNRVVTRPTTRHEENPQKDSKETEESCSERNGGCQHMCRTVRGEVQCSCFKGFQLSEDGKTCIDINECTENNGGCERNCNNRMGTFFCSCPSGYRLASDRKSCHDTNECLLNNGHGPCEDVCENIPGGYKCSCRQGTQLAKNQHACQDIDECAQDNFGCSHQCQNAYGTAYCVCPQGYYLLDDDKSCADFDECTVPEYANLCPGHCVNTIGSFRCSRHEAVPVERKPDVDERKEFVVVTTPDTHRQPEQLPNCPPGYRPSYEGYCQDINECEEGILDCSHRCVNTKGGAHCACPKGFALQLDKTTCEDINECEEGILNCSHRCVNTKGGAHCACPKGFALQLDKATCEDIDECQMERHNCHHTCINTIGAYMCSCLPGYILLRNGTCEGCRKNSYKSDSDEFCIECPSDSHTNGSGKTSLSDCICNSGYIGDPTAGESCTDIDECEENNFGCSHTCVNSPGSVHCVCPDGYELDHTGKTCKDVDECQVSNGGCQQKCENSKGSFKCLCEQGYYTKPSDPYSCFDIDECQKNNGGCDKECVNYEGGFYCTCPEGSRLSVDSKTCVEMTCHKFPIPSNSRVQCTNGDETTQIFPFGATCVVKCNKGYKLDGSNQLKCGSDQQWKGGIPSCIAQSCRSLKKPENGDIHPESCYLQANVVDQKCYFTCDQEYRLVGRPVLTCRKNLEWDSIEPSCEESVPLPFIQCPRDINVELPFRQNMMHVTIPEPKSNLDRKYISVQPDWITGLEGEFPAGNTRVKFTLQHPLRNKTAKCEMTVNIIDREPPFVYECPESFVVEADSIEGATVTWNEPTFEDNVGVISISKSLEPDTVMNVGTHVVQYSAKDQAGNTAHCGFLVNVTRTECGPLKGVLNGEVNCMEWIFGTACYPTCNDGYMFYSSMSDFYMCDSAGVWQPSERVPDCTPFVPEPEGGCLQGSELRLDEDSNTWICVECPRGMFWAAQNASCAECPVGTYQDEFGRSSCEPCQPDSTGLATDVAEACVKEVTTEDPLHLALPTAV